MIGDVPVRRHTVRGFDEDLAELTGKVVAMGGLVERQLGASIAALMQHDSAAAEQVIGDDNGVDALEEAIDRLAIRLLATRQPMAVDLRVVAMALKITNDLERMGDYAVNIAKRVRRITVQPQIKAYLTIPLMAGICGSMLKDVLDAYIERDDRKALAVWRRDREVDDYYDQVFRELVAYTLEDPKLTSICVDLMFVAKNLERIGDHATNIAEKIHYMVHGDELNRPRSEVP